MQRFKRSIASVLVPANIDPWPEVCDQLNTSMRGWSNYFCYGTRWATFRTVGRYIYERVREFLARRHRVAGRGTKRFSYATVYSMDLTRLVASR